MESGEKRNVWVEMTAIVAQDFCFFWGVKWEMVARESEKRKQENSVFCDMQCFDTFHFHSKRMIYLMNGFLNGKNGNWESEREEDLSVNR